MDFQDRQMIKVYDNDSEIEIEVIALIPSKRDDKKYSEVKISLDKSINEDIIVSYIFYKNNRLIDIFRIIYK